MPASGEYMRMVDSVWNVWAGTGISKWLLGCSQHTITKPTNRCAENGLACAMKVGEDDDGTPVLAILPPQGPETSTFEED